MSNMLFPRLPMRVIPVARGFSRSPQYALADQTNEVYTYPMSLSAAISLCNALNGESPLGWGKGRVLVVWQCSSLFGDEGKWAVERRGGDLIAGYLPRETAEWIAKAASGPAGQTAVSSEEEESEPPKPRRRWWQRLVGA